MLTLINVWTVAGGVVVILGFVVLIVLTIIVIRRESPGAISELVASNDELARRVRSLENDRARDHATLLSLQTRLESQMRYSRELASYSQAQAAYSAILADRLRLLDQDVPPAPGDPPTPPSDLFTPLPIEPAVSPESLSAILETLFNNEELDDLIFRIGGRPEDLIGATVARRAGSLVAWARRHGKLDKLIQKVQQLRPEIET